MTKRELVLAALATADGGDFSPVQIQKLLFLLDKKAFHLTGGPHFNFQPYDYGPFDKSVYGELRPLETEGMIVTESAPHTWARRYRLTGMGLAAGRAALDALPTDASRYMRSLSSWVRNQSFTSLVSATYKMYPEMKANSVFRD